MNEPKSDPETFDWGRYLDGATNILINGGGMNREEAVEYIRAAAAQEGWLEYAEPDLGGGKP